MESQDLEQNLVLSVFEKSKLELAHESLKQPEIADEADNVLESERPITVIETVDLEHEHVLSDCKDSKQGLVHETLKEPGNQEIEIEDDADNFLESQPISVIENDDLEQNLVLGVFENSMIELIPESLKHPDIADTADNVLLN